MSDRLQYEFLDETTTKMTKKTSESTLPDGMVVFVGSRALAGTGLQSQEPSS